MEIVMLGLAVWIAVAIGVAVVLGRSADRGDRHPVPRSDEPAIGPWLERAWEIEHLSPWVRRQTIRGLGWNDPRRYYEALLYRLADPRAREILGGRWPQLRHLAEIGAYRGIWEPEMDGQTCLDLTDGSGSRLQEG